MMNIIKKIAFVISIILLIGAGAMVKIATKHMADIPSASSYTDQGVHSFKPYLVLPAQVQNTSASSRDRRMNPTKTVYMVYYRATDGSSYQWSEQAVTRALGQKTVSAGTTVERRVLAIPDRRTYITVTPEQTADSYTSDLKRKYVLMLAIAGAYILLFFIWSWRKRRATQKA